MPDGSASPPLLELIEQHYRLVYRFAYRLTGSAADAEDLTQQTFLIAHRRIDQLREAERARGWLCAIARNTFLKSLRGKPDGPVASLENVAEPTDFSPEDLIIDGEELQQALGELPEEFRTPLILFYFEEFSYKEIAEQLDVPIGTVMSRLSRGKTWLRKQLVERQPEIAEAE